MKSKFPAVFLFSFISCVEKCFSIVPDAERFSSSIVASGNEMLFGLPIPQPQYTKEITRSYIDRDPIYFDDEFGSIDNGDNLDDPLQQFYNRHHDSHNMEQWQSPLEKLSPLPSALNSQADDSPSLHAGSPFVINSGWQHSHQIDVHRQQQNSANHEQQSQYKLKTRSTGTTIAALLANNSTVVILAADTRATDDSTVADKRCEKLHTLAKNVWCAGAGTSADVEAMVRRVKFTFWKRGVLNGRNVGIGNMGFSSGVNTQQLFSSEDNDVPVASIMAILHYLRTQLQKTRGALGVNLLVGGYEYGLQRAYLAAVHPHGSMDVVTYAALGSGGLAATGVLESRYPQVGFSECTIEEGIRLAVDAVKAGIDNDLGSGSQVDVCVISADIVMYRRAIVKEEELEWIDDNDSWYDAARKEKECNRSIASGVNGFGNLPFSIQSKEKIVIGGRTEAEREQRAWLDGVLQKKK